MPQHLIRKVDRGCGPFRPQDVISVPSGVTRGRTLLTGLNNEVKILRQVVGRRRA